MEICIDFDGTCVTHEFPVVGKDVGAVPVLQELVRHGHKLILFTMRSNRPIGGNTGSAEIEDVTGNFLDDAIGWFKSKNIPLYGIQSNPHQKTWTTSPKAYGHLYIDDAGIGCPLILDKNISKRPFVNWRRVDDILRIQGILPPKNR